MQADLEKHLGVDRLSVDVVTCLSHLQVVPYLTGSLPISGFSPECHHVFDVLSNLILCVVSTCLCLCYQILMS
jgi:hypothetical protein